MKEPHIPILHILDITTTAVIDIGSEVTLFFKFFYYHNGKNFNPITKIELKVFIPQQHI